MATAIPISPAPGGRPPRRPSRCQIAARCEAAVAAALEAYGRELSLRLPLTPFGRAPGAIASASVELRARVQAIVQDARLEAAGELGKARGTLYERLGDVGWRARVTQYIEETHRALVELTRRAGSGALSQLELARSIRETVDRLLGYRLRRIAVSEVFNAAREAQLERYAGDETVAAVRWVPTSADACLVCLTLARSDFYGLGPGVYPIDRVPLPPHPFCRCRLEPVRGVRVARSPARSGAIAVDGRISADDADAVRRRVRGVLEASARHPSRQRLGRLARRSHRS